MRIPIARHWYWACAALCLAALPAAPARQRAGSDPALASRIDAILGDPALRGGVQGVVVRSLGGSGTWYERNASTLLLPASNQKLITAAAALHFLGPHWTFTTRLLRAGPVQTDGTLRGCLVLQGGGDPLLAERDLSTLVEAVKAAGIRRVTGGIRGDDSRFDARRYGDGWAWDDMPYYYSAPVSALCLNENVALVDVDPGKRPGDPVVIAVTPAGHTLEIDCTATTGPPGTSSSVEITRDLGTSRVRIRGTVAVDAPPASHAPVRVTVPEPARFAAAVLDQQLRAAGIQVDAGPSADPPPPGEAVELAVRHSQPLAEVIRHLHEVSDNLVAECLLKTLAVERGGGAPGTWAAGRRVVQDWLATLGIDPAEIDMADGSGLSRQNWVTPGALARLLAAISTHPHGPTYRSTLSVAGRTGYLRARMRGTPAEGAFQGKTGYLSSVSSLSGYLRTTRGEDLVVVILMNGHKAPNARVRPLQDQIVALLAGWALPDSKPSGPKASIGDWQVIRSDDPAGRETWLPHRRIAPPRD